MTEFQILAAICMVAALAFGVRFIGYSPAYSRRLLYTFVALVIVAAALIVAANLTHPPMLEASGIRK